MSTILMTKGIKVDEGDASSVDGSGCNDIDLTWATYADTAIMYYADDADVKKIGEDSTLDAEVVNRRKIHYKTLSKAKPAIEADEVAGTKAQWAKDPNAIMFWRTEDDTKLEGGFENVELAGSLVSMNCGQFNVKAKGVTQEDSDFLFKQLKECFGCQSSADAAIFGPVTRKGLSADGTTETGYRNTFPSLRDEHHDKEAYTGTWFSCMKDEDALKHYGKKGETLTIANKQVVKSGLWPSVAINDNYKLKNDECCKKRKQTSLQQVLGITEGIASSAECAKVKCPRDDFYVDTPKFPSVCS
jgi:hypothetical protein